MVRSFNKILGSCIDAADGTIGKVDNVLFEDIGWRVGYFVIETGSLFRRHQVLLSPAAFGPPDWMEKTFPVSLTREQVRNSPDVDTDQPVSRQQEAAMSKYYGWPLWSGEYPAIPLEGPPAEESPSSDTHLRSCRELIGYHVLQGADMLGQIEDFYLDDQTWAIRYLHVHSGPHLGGHLLLLPPAGTPVISWTYRRVQLSPSS